MDAACVAHQIHLGKFKSKLEAALVFYKYMQGLGPSAISRGGGSKRYGNMLMEFEMPDAMEGGKANTIEKVGGASFTFTHGRCLLHIHIHIHIHTWAVPRRVPSDELVHGP